MFFLLVRLTVHVNFLLIHSVCPPLSNGSLDPNFENFKKGESEKNWSGGNQLEGGDFQKERGNPTFQVKFRDRKRQK